jgi:two-component SAPR family response regulator
MVELPSIHQPSPLLMVETLGRERVRSGTAEELHVRPQVRELFFFLLSRHPKGARSDELGDLFWPRLTGKRVDGTLQMTVTRIRQSLCPVEFTNGWYRLAPGRLWYDVFEFQRALEVAYRAQRPQARIARLLDALEYYGGDYLLRMDHPWVLVERERLRKAYLSALLNLARAHSEAHDDATALSVYERAYREEPLLEPAWQGAIQTQLRLGNRARALAQYREIDALLRQELGVLPSQELQTLYHQIQNQSV